MGISLYLGACLPGDWKPHCYRSGFGYVYSCASRYTPTFTHTCIQRMLHTGSPMDTGTYTHKATLLYAHCTHIQSPADTCRTYHIYTHTCAYPCTHTHTRARSGPYASNTYVGAEEQADKLQSQTHVVSLEIRAQGKEGKVDVFSR